TLSLASSKSRMSTLSLSLRAASSAASFTSDSRSAPENPGVPLAMVDRSTSVETGTRRACTRRIPSRPLTSGRGTTMRRSNRPGPDEHLDEVRTRDREERHARLARDRARQQRLAGARRPHHQDALRDAPAELGELFRIL